MRMDWEITSRKNGMAVAWRNGQATISVEMRRKKTRAGLGGRRYVARLNGLYCGALTLADAKLWIEENSTAVFDGRF